MADQSERPDLTGKVALVTGATSGIGLETAVGLASLGAHVVLGCRDPARARAAAATVLERVPPASVGLLALDLASQSQVRAAARCFTTTHDRLDVLVNNAGIMAPPAQRTEDGFELQLATNHLGHYALTGLLLDHLLTTEGSRVVTVTSLMHRMARLRPGQLQVHRYHRWRVYAGTKLANLLFAFELQRRLDRLGTATISVAAHPGWARSNLAATGPTMGRSSLSARAGRLAAARLGQSAAMGARPSLYAATEPGVAGGVCIGPSGRAQVRGAPTVVPTSAASHDPELAAAVWAESERLTGVTYPFAVGSPA